MATSSGFYRVLRAADPTLVASSRGTIEVEPFPGLTEGDLVRVVHGVITELVHHNQSRTPLHEQDWWRLLRVLPRLRRRQQIEADIRGWFDAQDFLLVTTPVAGTSPGLEVHLAAVEARIGGEQRYLMTSPEYHMKRLLSSGEPRLAYLGRAFRDDEAGSHHHAEFTMLEWYRADGRPADLMADVEALVALATGEARSWTTLTVAQALTRWAGNEAATSADPETIVRALVEAVEPNLASLGAVFLTDYPASLASLARLSPENPAVSERFEAYIDGVELANGFGELTCATEQRRRFEEDLRARRELGRPEYPIDERFLDALAAGLPPCAGIALGVDRLVMLALGETHLDEVVAFPPSLA